MLNAKTLRKLQTFPLGRWFPLVSLLSDPDITIAPYPSDSRWTEHKISPHRTIGFDPWGKTLFTSANSPLFEWLQSPETPPRRLNPNDRLVTDILFLIHDYLHLQFYRWAQSDGSFSELLRKKLLSRDRDFLATFHLASEAVATVGLDYWILAERDLNREIQMGTALTNFAVPFDRRHLPEIRSYVDWPRKPADVLLFIAEIYWTGHVPGKTARALAESPIVFTWLEKELGYGKLQRQYTREYFLRLLGPPNENCSSDPRDSKRIAQALSRFGQHLWNWSKHSQAFPPFSTSIGDPKTRFRSREDFRFFDIGYRSGRSALQLLRKNKTSAREIFFQFLASREFRPPSQEFVSQLIQNIHMEDWESGLRMVTQLKSNLPSTAYPKLSRPLFLID